VGYGGYQLGNFPPGWAEWNDRYRDTVRRVWRGDTNVMGELAGRITGSADIFNSQGRRPWSSINFVTAHDGFTLHDLVSYDRKHNEANAEDNRDGTDNNLSWNCGVEGPTDDPNIIALRERQKRNIMATMILSLGTPMITAGDEFGRTQHGNNNAYCQDSEIGWVNWQSRDDKDHAFTRFVHRLLVLRQESWVFRRNRFLTGDPVADTGIKDVTWLSPEGHEMKGEDWDRPNARTLGVQIFGGKKEGDDTYEELYLMLLNAADHQVDFGMPQPRQRGRWRPVFDTARPDTELATLSTGGGDRYPLLPRSFVLLEDS
jgi:glycogen operon protein